MTLLLVAFGCFALLALGLNAWQWHAASRCPLDRRQPHPGPWPAVAVLKPLKGADAETRRCLESWLTQRYPGPMELLFGVASAEDPACAVVRDLQQAFPTANARLVVCPPGAGVNAKVGTLIALAKASPHEVVVVSDADVAVPADLLSELVARLQDPAVGLVNCLYRLAAPRTPALRCEAVAVNVDFWSQVLQSRTLWPMDFALGAVMAMPRPWLAKAGGFEALANHLADDFQLGHRIFKAGGRIELCPIVVDCREAARGWGEVWLHQLRWARTIRVCRPAPYFFSVLNNGSLWALGLGAAASVAAATGMPQIGLVGGAIAAGCLAGRIGLALSLQARFVPERTWRAPWWMIVVRDVFGAAVWAVSFAGNEVDWRGQRFRVLRDGTLREST